MKRGARLLPLLGWTMAAACSGGGEETRGPAGADPAASTREEPEAAAATTPAASDRGTVPMTISGRVASYRFQISVTGECATSAESSIYEVPATQWHATYGGGDQSDVQHLNLTVWRPRSGAPDMATLYFQSGETTHRIATVQGGEMAGSGTAGASPEGRGGTLTVTGKDDHGHELELSVRCERFDEVIAEGG